MKGSVEKRGEKVYRIRLHLGYDQGKRITHRETVHGTKAQAEKRMRDIIQDYERGIMVKRSTQSLNDFLADWLKTIATSVRRRTLDDYQGLIERYLAEELGKLPLDRVTSMAIQKVYNALSGRGLSGRTVRRLHSVVNQALRQAVLWRMLTHNPAADIQLPRLKIPRVNRALDMDQAQAFLAATHTNALYGPAFRLAIETGLRPQEYCALFWSDVDWHKGTIRVQRAMTWPVGGGWVLEEPKSESGRRVVKLSPEGLADLRAHRKNQLELRMLLGHQWQGTEDFVFSNQMGAPLRVKGIGVAFKQILAAAGLPSTIRPYDLRHTSATFLLLGQVPAKVASERLGHSTIVLTLNTYSHVLESMQEMAADTMGMLLHRRPAPVTRIDQNR